MASAEIICIGTELLLGQKINTNSAYISCKLNEAGINVYYHTIAGDNPERLLSALKLAVSRSDIVIATGGLGPTVDDITLEALAGLSGKKLILNKGIASRIREIFRKRSIKMPISNMRQAYLPMGAKPIRNNAGTAPGIILHLNKKIVIALPGVPREMEPMLNESVIPFLKKKYPGAGIIKSKMIKVAGLSESAVDEKVKDLLAMGPTVTVGIYAHPGQIDLNITARANTGKTADRMIKKVEKEIYRRLKDFIFGSDNRTLEEEAGQLLVLNHKTIAIAESSTGGLISHRITNVPGSSKYFLLGVVAYSNNAKINRLNVPPDLIKKYGAVSKQVAESMAEGVRKSAGAGLGLSVTGIAGPGGGTVKKPVGLVYIGLAAPERTFAVEFRFRGNRDIIKHLTSQYALDMVRKYLGKIKA